MIRRQKKLSRKTSSKGSRKKSARKRLRLQLYGEHTARLPSGKEIFKWKTPKERASKLLQLQKKIGLRDDELFLISQDSTDRDQTLVLSPKCRLIVSVSGQYYTEPRGTSSAEVSPIGCEGEQKMSPVQFMQEFVAVTHSILIERFGKSTTGSVFALSGEFVDLPFVFRISESPSIFTFRTPAGQILVLDDQISRGDPSVLRPVIDALYLRTSLPVVFRLHQGARRLETTPGSLALGKIVKVTW